MAEHRINHEPVFLLASTPWRESSLWVEAFSRHYGRIALLARSARKRQSELRGVLVAFVPFSASWYGSGELKTLHRAEWTGGWQQPQGRALFSGLYVNELMLKLTAREDPMPELYDVLADTMRTICTETDHAAALRRFEWTLLTQLGIAPDLQCDGNGEEIAADRLYRIMPEEAVMPESTTDAPPGSVRHISGSSLIDLHKGSFSSAKSLQQALKITRMMTDRLLPEGIKSRQVLQQLQQFELKD